MKEILVDIETYSEVDIGKCGLYRYATDPSFEILLIAWATMREPALVKPSALTLHQEKPFQWNCWRHFSPEVCG